MRIATASLIFMILVFTLACANTTGDSPSANTSPTSTPATLPTVPCPEPCNRNEDIPPISGHVDWLEPPTVTSSGEFSFKARIHDGHDLIVGDPSPEGGRLNVHFSRGDNVYGSVLPVDNTEGWRWKEKPTTWEADVYDYKNKVLTVVAQINPDAATHQGLRMCLWSGGTREDTYILDCIEVERP